MYTRISDNIFDSSLWSDGSYEGCATLKLWLAVLAESRRDGGHFRRLTPAKAARIASVPTEIAVHAIERLIEPDPNDSSGIAEGRRLVRDPEGGPNDYLVTNWDAYGRQFEREAKAARQKRWRSKRTEGAADVDGNVYTPSTRRRSVDEVETVRETQDREEREVREEKKKRLVGSRDAETVFEERWARYPKKDGKRDARRHFLASVRDESSLAQFDRALSGYLAKISAERIAPTYVKNGSTFFSNWTDWTDYRPLSAAGPRLVTPVAE